MKKVTIKPHHLLDIVKLYGAGIVKFVPNPKYNHDFYRIANIVMKKPKLIVTFTKGVDDICTPCIFNKDGFCTDTTKGNPHKYSSKDWWNKTIDGRIMDTLNIKEGDKMTVLKYFELAQTDLTPKKISAIWKERPKEETKRRKELLKLGLAKYITKSSTHNT